MKSAGGLLIASLLASLVGLLAAQTPKPSQSARAATDSSCPHAYFDALVARPEHHRSWSLRSQAQLDSLVADATSRGFTYDPVRDAARYYHEPKGDRATMSLRGKQQVRFPIGAPTDPISRPGTSILLTFDWWMGEEFRTNHGRVTNIKMFQLMVGGHAWWTWMESPGPIRGGDGSTAVTVHTDEFRPGTRPAGMVQHEQVAPSGAGTPVQGPGYRTAHRHHHSRWTRYVMEVRLCVPPSAFTDWNETYGVTVGPNPLDADGGRWHMVSLWSIDERRDAQRILWRVPMAMRGPKGTWSPHLSVFRFEFNSSKKGLAGPLVGYARNLVILRDYKLPSVPETDALIFQRPVR